MDPSQFNGPGLQAAPGILQWLARLMGGGDRPGPQMASTGRPATQSPPTRSGIGVMPGAQEPFVPASTEPPQMGAGMSFTPPLPTQAPAPMPQPVPPRIYPDVMPTAPLRSSLEPMMRPPIPRQKPARAKPAAKASPKPAPGKTSKPAAKKPNMLKVWMKRAQDNK
jgi:hypothetical protein